MPQFDVDAARRSGASDDEILSYLAQRAPNFDIRGALRETSKQEVIGYLASHSMAPTGPTPRPDFAKNPPPMPAPPNAIARQELQNPSSPNFAGELPGTFEGKPENVGSYGAASVGEIYGGARDIGRGDVARGAHRIIGGTVTGAAPFAVAALPAALASAPVATSLAVGGGIAGQYGGERAATALGATPDQAALVGDIAGLGAAYAGAKVPGMVSRISSPLGDVVAKPRGSIPPEQFSPTELKSYADQNGIPLNAAQATGHNLPRNLQSAGERATVGGTAVRKQTMAGQAAVIDHAEKLASSFSPNTPDLPSAGSAIRASVDQALAREQMASRQMYAAIDQKAGGVSVDLRPLKQTAQKILADSDFVRKVGALDPKKATAILQDMANLPNQGSFSDAQQLRSALLDASRTPELAISNQAQAWVKQLTGTVDGEMMKAATSKPGLEQAFRTANSHWEQLQDDFNNPRSPLAQILREPDPSKVPQKLTQRGQIGGSPYNVQLLDKYGINKGPVKWTILNDLMDKDFRLWNKTLGGYSQDFLGSLFAPNELQAVYKTGAIARSLGLNTNPSGTAAVSGAMEDVKHPIITAGPKAAAAKLTQSPAFNAWLLRPGRGSGGRVPLSVLLNAARSNWQPSEGER